MSRLLERKLSGPWRITFDTNPDDCNLRCLMCEERSIYKKIRTERHRLMRFDMVRKVVSSAMKFGLSEIIPSTMGEPLLYPSFHEFLELVKAHHLKLNVTTNGTFPQLGPRKWGKLLLPLASDVKISINGATKTTAESIMLGINFERQLANSREFIEVRDEVASARKNNPTITLQVTFMERNLAELPELLRSAIDMGFDRFKGHHLWVTWPELREESLKRNRGSRERWNRIVGELKHIAHTYRRNHGRRIRLDNVVSLPIDKQKGTVPSEWGCPFLGREAWIAWDGTFNVCCSPDNLRRTLGYFGNVNDSDFIDLWNSANYNTLLSNWGKHRVCGICNMRRPATGAEGC